MLTARLQINPNLEEVSYEIEGPIEELAAIDLSSIEQMNALVNKINSRLEVKGNGKTYEIRNNNSSGASQKQTIEESTASTSIEINVPVDLIESILKLEERIRFPILWHFSNHEKMTIKDFLMACAKKGFTLSSSWLPSAGGNFKGRLVNEDKMFHEAGKIGNQTAWALTDVGKLKIMKELEKLKAHI